MIYCSGLFCWFVLHGTHCTTENGTGFRYFTLNFSKCAFKYLLVGVLKCTCTINNNYYYNNYNKCKKQKFENNLT